MPTAAAGGRQCRGGRGRGPPRGPGGLVVVIHSSGKIAALSASTSSSLPSSSSSLSASSTPLRPLPLSSCLINVRQRCRRRRPGCSVSPVAALVQAQVCFPLLVRIEKQCDVFLTTNVSALASAFVCPFFLFFFASRKKNVLSFFISSSKKQINSFHPYLRSQQRSPEGLQ